MEGTSFYGVVGILCDVIKSTDTTSYMINGFEAWEIGGSLDEKWWLEFAIRVTQCINVSIYVPWVMVPWILLASKMGEDFRNIKISQEGCFD